MEGALNSAISLFWQIQLEDCANGGRGCYQVSLYTSRSSGPLYHYGTEDVRAQDFLFKANTTIYLAGEENSTFTHANVRLIMYIDEYVKANVTDILCIATLSNNGYTYKKTSMVNLSVTESTLPSTTTSSSQCTCWPLDNCTTKMLPKQASGSVSVLISLYTKFYLKLLTFQALFVVALCN